MLKHSYFKNMTLFLFQSKAMKAKTILLVLLSFSLFHGSEEAVTELEEVNEVRSSCVGRGVTISNHADTATSLRAHMNQFCDKKEPGFYAVSDDNCQSYVICDPQGFSVILQCPSGHLFDQDNCLCVERNTTEWRPQPICRKHGVPHNHCGLDTDKLLKRKDHFCKAKESGWYADVDRGCRYFGHCRHEGDSRPVFVKCPSRMMFSPKDNNCILKSGGDGECKSLSLNGTLSSCHIPIMNFCPFLDPGCYSDIFDDCHSYIQCDGSCVTYYNRCPWGQIFDMTKCACVDEAVAKCLVPCHGCVASSSTTTELTTTSKATTTTTITTPSTPSTTPSTPSTTPSTTSTAPSMCCPKSANGLSPDVSTNCTTFHACYGNHIVKKYRCDMFSSFDVRECRCVTLGMGKCLTDDGSNCCIPGPPLTTVPTSSVATTPYSDFCVGKAAGYYADSDRDCEWYFVCRGGHFETTQIQCPSHLRFSHDTCRCEFPSDVTCTIFDMFPPCPLVI